MKTAANKIPANDAKEKVWDLIKDIKTAMMVTQDAQGRLFSRPMQAIEHDAADRLWFFTPADSPKITEIKNHSDILLSYAEPDDNNFVSISGKAVVSQDRAKINELWVDYLKAWFPKGKDDPNIALICVEPQSAEYWDSPSSAFVKAFGYAKAKLTGKPENMGENQTVEL